MSILFVRTNESVPSILLVKTNESVLSILFVRTNESVLSILCPMSGMWKCLVYVVVQFYPWFKILFPLFQTHYHQITITKTKEIKF